MENGKRLLFGNSKWGMVMRIIVLFTILTAPFFYHYGVTFLLGRSMYPAYECSEMVIIEKNHDDYIPWRYDVVEIKVGKERWIKRIIGLPGDHIVFGLTTIWLNGKILTDYEWIDPDSIPSHSALIEADLIVPPNHVWVIGDNRTNSAHTLVNMDNIVGKVIY